MLSRSCNLAEPCAIFVCGRCVFRRPLFPLFFCFPLNQSLRVRELTLPSFEPPEHPQLHAFRVLRQLYAPVCGPKTNLLFDPASIWWIFYLFLYLVVIFFWNILIWIRSMASVARLLKHVGQPRGHSHPRADTERQIVGLTKPVLRVLPNNHHAHNDRLPAASLGGESSLRRRPHCAFAWNIRKLNIVSAVCVIWNMVS